MNVVALCWLIHAHCFVSLAICKVPRISSIQRFILSVRTNVVRRFAGVVIECAELEEGDYSVGCTPDYVSCVDRFGVKRRCNDGLVFSAVSKQCVSPEHCTSSKVIESPMTTAIAAEAVRHTAHSG